MIRPFKCTEVARLRSWIRLIFFSLVPFILSLHCASGLTVTDVSPLSGAPGTVVTISGSGFDPGQTYTISINSAYATADSVTVDTITFTVPGNASTGALILEDTVESFELGVPFTVLRMITGEFRPPPGVSSDGYLVGTLLGVSELSAGQAAFNAEVYQDSPMLAAAGRGPDDPTFLAVVTSEQDVIVIDSESTAFALVYLTPFLVSGNDTRTRSLRESITGLPEFASLVEAIEGASANGQDFFEDGRMETALRDLLIAFDSTESAPVLLSAMAEEPQLVIEKGPIRQSYFKPINPDVSVTNVTWETHFLTEASFPPGGIAIKPFLSADSNPVNWTSELFLVDPGQFTNGLHSIAGLNADSILTFRSDIPLNTAVLPNDPAFAWPDPLGKLTNLVYDAIYAISGIEEEEEPDLTRFVVPRDIPAVYVHQSYSGNLWYGLVTEGAAISQSALLDANDPNSQWLQALAVNTVNGALDVISVGAPFERLIGRKDLADLTTSLVTNNLMKLRDIFTDGGLTTERALELVKSNIEILYDAVNATEEEAEDAAVATLGKRISDSVKSTFDVFEKIATGLSIGQRLAGIFLPSPYAIERTVFVIGDPFLPRITKFWPRTGRGGYIITVSGYNLPTNADNLKLYFCQYAGTSTGDDPLNPPEPSTKVEAEILGINEYGSLVVRVPAGLNPDGSSIFTNNRALLCLEETGEAPVSTAENPEPNVFFQYLPAPEIISIEPTTVAPRGTIRIHGNNFEGLQRHRNEVIIDGEVNPYSLGSFLGNTTNLRIRLDPLISEGPHTLSVRIGDFETNTINFTVENPVPETSPTAGRSIQITRLDASNTPDGEISVLEALLIASDSLGRPIEEHEPCEFLPEADPRSCPFQQRETDFVGGDNPGPDTITFAPGVDPTGVIINVGADMPTSFTDGDSIDLNGLTLDGLDLASGLVFDGSTGISLRRMTLRNFAGDAVTLRNGAKNCEFVDVFIDSPTGRGIVLEGNAQQNLFDRVSVSFASGDGIHLDGTNVKYNTFLSAPFPDTSLVEECTGYGWLIENGASFNEVQPGMVRANGLGGMRIIGPEASANIVGYNSEFYAPGENVFLDNVGHGIHATSTHSTVFKQIEFGGNQGDGIRIEGPNAYGNQIHAIVGGYDEKVNTGSGVVLMNQANGNLIGDFAPGDGLLRGGITGNTENGILLDNVHNTTINRTNVGPFDSPRFTETTNGMNGIRLTNGTSGTIIGSWNERLDVHITGAPNGAGILIDGPETSENEVFGCQIGRIHGFDPSQRLFPTLSYELHYLLQDGIVLANGAHGNQIGQAGRNFSVLLDELGTFVQYQPFNVIGHCTRYGILLDDAGGTLDENNQLVSPNVLINNRIGASSTFQQARNKYGIGFTNGARNNIVGGYKPDEGNYIGHSSHACIHYDNNQLTNHLERNRLHQNIIVSGVSSAGAASSGIVPPAPTNPLETGTPSTFTGILVEGVNTQWNQIGEGLLASNRVTGNQVGIHITDGATNTLLGGFEIDNNRLFGVLVDEADNNRIGAEANGMGNELYRNGSWTNSSGLDPLEGGIFLKQADGNSIVNNLIGTTSFPQANKGTGIYLENSDNNLIGSSAVGFGNRIWLMTSHGIWLTGDSSGNKIASNYIGIQPDGIARRNVDVGVLIDGTSSNNEVGTTFDTDPTQGLSVPVPGGNWISNNLENGVEVRGGTGNSILTNRIWNNTLMGIDLNNTGNELQPAPIPVLYEDQTLSGYVDSLGTTPAGSLIQVFVNEPATEPEGQTYVGQTTVDESGNWRVAGILPPVPGGSFTVTATHAGTGSTSEFSSFLQVPEQSEESYFELARTDGLAPSPKSVNFDYGEVTILGLTATATRLDVVAQTLSLKASGSLNDTLFESARLLHDRDSDGQVSDADLELSSSAFTMDDGSLSFTFDRHVIAAGFPQDWLVLLSTNNTLIEGQTVTLEIISGINFSGVFELSGQPVSAGGTYPIESDLFTVGANSYDEWIAGKLPGTNESERNPYFDFDGDGLLNIEEAGSGLEPGLNEARNITEARVEDGKFVFEFRRSVVSNSVTTRFEISSNLSFWSNGDAFVESTTTTDNGDGSENVVVTTTIRTEKAAKMFGRLRYYID